MQSRLLPLFLSIACCFGQAPQSPVISSTTKEVVLDLVVRDKHGHLVNDLRPDEVSVYEDGAPQKVTSFRNVQGKEQLEAEKAAARVEATAPGIAHPLNSLRELNFVSIIFAPMAMNNLAFAREAVLDFLKNDMLPNTYITVYRLDTRLRLVQPYTHDKAALTTAVNHLTNADFLMHSSNLASTVMTNSSPVAGNAASTARGTGDPLGQGSFDPSDMSLARNIGGLDASAGLNAALQAESALENGLRFAENNVTGMTVLDQLRNLILSQSRLPGRKIALYLSDGLRLPANREDVFKGIVSDANRSGVTFYTVDTRGLTSPNGPNPNPLNASISQLDRISRERGQQGALASGTLSGSQNIQGAFDAASVGDDIQLLSVSNTQLALQDLAVRTGGFAVMNTNEIAKPMERVMEDIRTHYELAYSPLSPLYDGHFRKIEVKVNRPKVTVQARNGYYALPELNGEPIQPFEMAALKAINARPSPKDFSYEAALLQFRPGTNAMQCELAFEIPIAGLKITPDPKTGKARIAISVMGLLRDSHDQIVHKVSRQLFRAVPNADIKAAQNEKIDYMEAVELAPGHYSLDTAVVDGEGNTVAAKRLAVFVRQPSKLDMSSVQIVKRVDPLSGERNPLNPFQMQDRRVTLTLGEDVASGKPVDLYFVVYPSATGSQDPAKLLVELLHDGKEAARISSDLPKPDETGAIPMLAELKPDAGQYEVLVTVRQGALATHSARVVTVH